MVVPLAARNEVLAEPPTHGKDETIGTHVCWWPKTDENIERLSRTAKSGKATIEIHQLHE